MTSRHFYTGRTRMPGWMLWVMGAVCVVVCAPLMVVLMAGDLVVGGEK